MNLKYVLFLSICTFLSTSLLSDALGAKSSSSGKSAQELERQLAEQKIRVKQLEAEIVKLKGTITRLSSLTYAPGQQSSPALPQKKYIIKEGETITQIASQHGITRKALMQANHIVENQQIYIGDKLIIPSPPAPPAPAPQKSEVASASTVKTAPEKPTPPVKPAPVEPKSETNKTPKPPTPTTLAWTTSPEPKKETVTPEKSEATTSKKESSLAKLAKMEKSETKAPSKAESTPKPPSPAPEKKPSISDLVKKDTKPEPAVASTPAKTETPPSDPDFTYYTIQFGDNLGKIAKKHGISLGALIHFNDIKNPDKISGGQKLKIPSKEKAKSYSIVKPAAAPAVASTDTDKPQADDAYGVYTVQSGDNLYNLARDFFTTEKEIQELNEMGTKTTIVPGQELIVPTAEYFKRRNLANN